MSLPCTLKVVFSAALVLVAYAGRNDVRSQNDWDVPATAAVFSGQRKDMPKESTQAVELLRFVTAYKRGLESLVDITPYSALLRASADTDGFLSFFAFIDTWVGNNTAETKPVMSLDAKGQCTPSTKKEEAWGGGGSQGNGWQIDADLVFWPREDSETVDTRPRESITLSSGYYGAYSIGDITTHEGTLVKGGSEINIQGGVDLTGTLDAEVYPCPGGAEDIKRGFKMGELAQKAQSSTDDISMADVINNIYNKLSGDDMKVLDVVGAGREEGQVQVNYDGKEMRLEPGMPVWYETADIKVANGSDVFKDGVGKVIATDGPEGGIATIQITGACLPSKASSWLPRLKLEKFPNALSIARKAADSMKVIGKRLTGVAAPERPSEAGAISLLARRRVEGNSRLSGDQGIIFKPFLVGLTKESTMAPMNIVGTLDLTFLSQEGADTAPQMVSFLETAEKETKMPSGLVAAKRHLTVAHSSPRKAAASRAGSEMLQLSEGDKVCILARRGTGRVFERTFNMPTFVPSATAKAAPSTHTSEMHSFISKTQTTATSQGDRVLLQFSVTGHGWDGSTDKCGEFCHAVYHIKMNGEPVASVTEWRNDCAENPVDDQEGTFRYSRNGWCPGSVEPGLYIDVTKWANNGANTFSVDLSVWSEESNSYVKYTNYGNYISGGDTGKLYVGATMFIYDVAAVDVVKKQEKAYTAAETALRIGCSIPKALEPPENGLEERRKSKEEKEDGSDEQEDDDEQATSKRPETVNEGPEAAVEASSNSRYDFEAKAPWYDYDEKKEGKPEDKGATVVTAFKNGLIQINTREIRAKVPKSMLPTWDWGRAALHIRLEKPTGVEGLEMDNWDRAGSLGLLFEENAATTKNPDSPVKLHPSEGRLLTSTWKLGKVGSLSAL